MDRYLIDGHKLYWHLDRVAEWKEKRIILPIYIEISPVSSCNHRCIYCGVDFANYNGTRLDTNVLCERLREMGITGIRSVMFAGEGEPLLHKDLPELVRIAKNSGIDVSITTNGTLGGYDLWKGILPHLTWIRFSVDAGTARVYSRVHNVSECYFNKTIKSIEDAVRIKKEFALEVTIGVQFLIIEENIYDIGNALSLFGEIGVDYLSLKPYSLHPQMLNKREMIYTGEKIRHIEETIEQYRGNSDLNVIFRKDALVKYMDREKKFNHCYALPFWGYISSRGDFYTCSVFIGDDRFKAGNIYESDMDSIIFGEKRRGSIIFGEKTLAIKDECRFNCRMARINEFLEILQHRPEHLNFI